MTDPEIEHFSVIYAGTDQPSQSRYRIPPPGTIPPAHSGFGPASVTTPQSDLNFDSNSSQPIPTQRLPPPGPFPEPTPKLGTGSEPAHLHLYGDPRVRAQHPFPGLPIYSDGYHAPIQPLQRMVNNESSARQLSHAPSQTRSAEPPDQNLHRNGIPNHSVAPSSGLPAGQYDGCHTTYNVSEQGQGIPRKRGRTSSSCNDCRILKQRCDGKRPCAYCQLSKSICVYEAAAPRMPKRHIAILKKPVQEPQDNARLFQAHQRKILPLAPADQQRNRRESFQGQSEDSTASKHSSDQCEVESIAEETLNMHTTGLHNQTDPSEVGSITGETLSMHSTDVHDRSDPSEVESIAGETLSMQSTDVHDRSDPSEVESISEETLSMHSTGVHNLANWNTIKQFYEAAKVRGADYIYKPQGILEFLGHGPKLAQDFDASPSFRAERDPPYSARIPPPTTIVFGDWNNPRSSTIWTNLAIVCVNGVKLNENVIKRLHDCYMRNMWILFPILDPAMLKQQIEHFISSYCPPQSLLTPCDPGTVPLKRKFDSGPEPAVLSANPSSYGYSAQAEGYIGRSMPVAIVFLVLALGELCETDHFLGLPTESCHPGYHCQPSAPRMANVSSTHSHGTPNTMMHDVPESDSNSGGDNVDRYPGLDYCLAAASIMEDLDGGHTLTDAYAYILAGLYWGQLGRVMQSASYISRAANIVSELRMHHEEEITISSDPGVIQYYRKRSHFANQLCIVFYSVLQLESDIRAELDRLPPSPLTSLTERNGKVVRTPDYKPGELELFYGKLDMSKVMLHFLAQCSLRRHLNRTHIHMYSDRTMYRNFDKTAEDFWTFLQSWRKVLPPELQWKDDDSLSSDVLVARLRAKYYGAAYIINRPYVYLALHDNVPLDGIRVMALRVKDLKASFDDDTIEDGLQACQRCIAAALYSTTALDGLAPGIGMSRRPRISNLYGTVTAQFGNMLVVAAVFLEPRLQLLVPIDQFWEAMKRTLKFLTDLAPLSSVYRINRDILQHAANEVYAEWTRRMAEFSATTGSGTTDAELFSQ